jgi:hypothetical protein
MAIVIVTSIIFCGNRVFTTEIIPLQNGGHNGHYLVAIFHLIFHNARKVQVAITNKRQSIFSHDHSSNIYIYIYIIGIHSDLLCKYSNFETDINVTWPSIMHNKN